MEENIVPIAWFLEDGIYYMNEKQPLRKTYIIQIGNIMFDWNTCKDDDIVSVLSNEGNYYDIKKSEIHLLSNEEIKLWKKNHNVF